MRRIVLYGVGLILAFLLGLSYTATSRANAHKGPTSHNCAVTDRAFIETAKTNMAAITLWGQEYVDGDASSGDVADQSDRAAKIVGATTPTDPSLIQARQAAPVHSAGPHVLTSIVFMNRPWSWSTIGP